MSRIVSFLQGLVNPDTAGERLIRALLLAVFGVLNSPDGAALSDIVSNAALLGAAGLIGAGEKNPK